MTTSTWTLVEASDSPPFPSRFRSVSFVALFEDGWSAHCPELPGVVGQGETAAEAIEDCWQGLKAVLQTYADLGREVPWQPTDERAFPIVQSGLAVEVPQKISEKELRSEPPGPQQHAWDPPATLNEPD